MRASGRKRPACPRRHRPECRATPFRRDHPPLATQRLVVNTSHQRISMDLGLSGKVALVTGSSRGIGRGVALALAAEGCDLVLTGRDQKALDEVAAAIHAKGRKAAVTALDLREDGAPANLIDAARRAFGQLDILVNNAGTTKRGDFFELTDADWQD